MLLNPGKCMDNGGSILKKTAHKRDTVEFSRAMSPLPPSIFQNSVCKDSEKEN